MVEKAMAFISAVCSCFSSSAIRFLSWRVSKSSELCSLFFFCFGFVIPFDAKTAPVVAKAEPKPAPVATPAPVAPKVLIKEEKKIEEKETTK